MLSDTIRKQALYFSENIDNKLTNKTSAVVKNFIKLKEGKNNLNLFLFAPVSGLVFWYTKLSSYLNLDFTIYGIQDASINENHNIFNSFDELINTYYKALIHFQNNGLFFIGGASFGATVAVEIVNRLENNRMNVCFLGLFDGWALYPAIFKDKNFFKQLMERQILRFENNNIFQSTEHTNLIEIQRQRMLSLFNYNPPSINSPACLFKASELLPEYLEIDNRTNYWEEYISHLKLIVTSFSMMSKLQP